MNYFTGKACNKCLGLNCLLDLGFIGRGNGITGLSWNSLSEKMQNLTLNRKLSAFLVASDYMVEVLNQHKFPKDRIHKIPLFVKSPVDIDKSLPSDTDGGGNQGRQKNLILFAGQLIRGKGVDLLISALSNLKNDFKAMIVGSGNELLKLRNQAEDLGISDKVTFVGRVPQEELAKYYREAALVVVPSRAPETFCLVGPEAMSYGTPVVGVDVGGITEWLKDNVNGLLVAGYNPEALSEAIDRLLSDPDTARRLGERGRVDYENKFHINSYGKQFSSLIESLIQGNKGEVTA
jgi:glycosyltransferase involved in cell wall biosynthesis